MAVQRPLLRCFCLVTIKCVLSEVEDEKSDWEKGCEEAANVWRVVAKMPIKRQTWSAGVVEWTSKVRSLRAAEARENVAVAQAVVEQSEAVEATELAAAWRGAASSWEAVAESIEAAPAGWTSAAAKAIAAASRATAEGATALKSEGVAQAWAATAAAWEGTAEVIDNNADSLVPGPQTMDIESTPDSSLDCKAPCQTISMLATSSSLVPGAALVAGLIIGSGTAYIGLQLSQVFKHSRRQSNWSV
eukprot:gnl/MRDRNA2_/MRDRNA2_111271_c0_seq1.p1 gnl/MRDRNA2_/MRDRNA2_111271_c0~~gnl/MRDRNA2_/MRDRNA2_111271_c0_seq1.p1  ORF type:complete len:246 (-),score=46.65 gnl/MRDRNA2_/MRDRNA2_111271_c0_seq1:24-761(-)